MNPKLDTVATPGRPGAGQGADRMRMALAARTLAKKQGDDQALVEACCLLARTMAGRERWIEADRALLEAEVAAASAALPDAQVETALLAAEFALERRAESAAAKVAVAASLVERYGDPVQRARTRALQAWLCAREGEPHDVELFAARSLQLARGTGCTSTLAEVALLVARGYLEAGLPLRALAQASRVAAWAKEQGETRYEAQGRALIARLAAHRQDPRVELLVTLATEVGRKQQLDQVLDAICSAALRLVDTERVFVILKSRDGELEVKASRARDGLHAGAPSMSIVRRTLRSGREIISSDLQQHEQLGQAVSIIDLGLQVAICVPIGDGMRIMGAIYADGSTVPLQTLEEAAWLMRALGTHAGVAVANARQWEETVRQSRQARETIHDVRNVVSAISCGLEMLMDEDLPDWAAGTLQRLTRMNATVLRQVQGALDQRERTARPVDVTEVAREVASFLDPEARRRRIGLTVEAEPDTPTVVAMDPDDLGRVLTNLVGNALKYTPDQTRVQVRVERDGNTVAVTVQDAGPGIRQEDRDRIFRSGEQGADALPGHGLGLGICLRIVEQANGVLTVRDGPEGGALFEVRIPALDEPMDPPA